MAQRLRRLVAAMNGANQALEPYRDVRRIGGGSQDSAHVSVGRAFALTGALDHGWLNAEPRGTPINLWDDPDESDGWTGHDPGSVQVAEQGYEPESAGEFDYLTSV